MAAVSLFWDANMAAVTSCENTLYPGYQRFFFRVRRAVRSFIGYRPKPRAARSLSCARKASGTEDVLATVYKHSMEKK